MISQHAIQQLCLRQRDESLGVRPVFLSHRKPIGHVDVPEVAALEIALPEVWLGLPAFVPGVGQPVGPEIDVLEPIATAPREVAHHQADVSTPLQQHRYFPPAPVITKVRLGRPPLVFASLSIPDALRKRPRGVIRKIHPVRAAQLRNADGGIHR